MTPEQTIAHLTRVIDRFVIAHARDHGITERAVRVEFGLEQQAEQWAEEKPWEDVPLFPTNQQGGSHHG